MINREYSQNESRDMPWKKSLGSLEEKSAFFGVKLSGDIQ